MAVQIVSVSASENDIFLVPKIHTASIEECTHKEGVYYTGYLCFNCRKHFKDLTRCLEHTKECIKEHTRVIM